MSLYARGSWRDHAATVILRVIDTYPDLDEAALRQKIRDAYPFGEREHWPYKVWLSEVKYQLTHLANRRSQRMMFPLT